MISFDLFDIQARQQGPMFRWLGGLVDCVNEQHSYASSRREYIRCGPVLASYLGEPYLITERNTVVSVLPDLLFDNMVIIGAAGGEYVYEVPPNSRPAQQFCQVKQLSDADLIVRIHSMDIKMAIEGGGVWSVVMAPEILSRRGILDRRMGAVCFEMPVELCCVALRACAPYGHQVFHIASAEPRGPIIYPNPAGHAPAPGPSGRATARRALRRIELPEPENHHDQQSVVDCSRAFGPGAPWVGPGGVTRIQSTTPAAAVPAPGALPGPGAR